ncbi:hypothetical protein [Meiothermus hypogaeus]|uniref:hypothetical protein n=1 Tax=Meiothermus hypogaeus TaxID=884155 RepID=UPI0011BDAF30|nr:hypothetical protein [Meiothermus hypogaeus]
MFAPYESDLHPNHAAASRLCVGVIHFAVLPKAPVERMLHKAEHLLFYTVNYPAPLAVDISD